MAPERPEEETPDTVYGLPLERNFPKDWTPIECLVVVKALGPPEDDEYHAQRLFWASTPDLPTWEAAGMVDFVKHTLKNLWDIGSVNTDLDEDD